MIKKILKYTGVLLAVAMVVIQFINRPEKHFQEVSDNDITIALELNVDMQLMLKSACYDCHSNQPSYPWYASIAPVSWWIDDHMEHGRDELNFSEWATYSKRRRDHKLEEMVEEVEGGHMPLSSYKWMHPEARLTETQIAALKTWVEAERVKIAAED